MPPPSDASPLSECGNCLLIMACLALIAGMFIVISAILCERVFHGSLPPEARRVPSVWRQGGTLWIEPNRSHKETDVLSRQPETAPLWIQRTQNWFMDVLTAEQDASDSIEYVPVATQSPSTSSPLWDHNEPTWRLQPHVTLQDLQGFFKHSSRHT